MRWHRMFIFRLRSLFRRSKTESELQLELEDHLRQEIEANMAAGMNAEEARYAAQRSLGSVSLYQEECRDARGTAVFENLLRDLRYTVRVLGHSPLFTIVAIITLGLGIGGNTTISTLVNKLLLRPLPVRDPQRLVSLNTAAGVNFSYPNYKDIRDRNDVLSGLAALRFNPLDLRHSRARGSTWGRARRE